MKVLGIIPARGNSKRIRRKNLREVCGNPLIHYTINAARQAKSLTKWVVSTEDYEIGQVSVNLGAHVIRRPEELAQDDTTTYAVLRHAYDWLEEDFDIIVCLHPTSPVRDPKHIDDAVSLLAQTRWADTLASACRLPKKTHPNVVHYGEYRDGDFAILNASIYALKRDWFLRNSSHVGGETVFFEMDRRHSLDVDEEVDLKLAELFLAA